MDKLMMETKEISREQQKLFRAYTAVTDVYQGVDEMMLALDLGSTETRSLLFSLTSNDLDDCVAVPAAFSFLSDPIDWVRSKSTMLWDNLEIDLTDATPQSEKSERMFNDVRIIKGGLLQELKSPVEKAQSNVGKVEQPVTYINAICNAGIRAFIQQASTGLRPSKINCDLTIALPPEDTKSHARVESFKARMAGTYRLSLPRLGYEVTLEVRKDKIFYESESKAVLRQWATENSEDVNDYKRVIVIDGGGRSTDLGYLEDGRLIESGSETLAFGGNRLEKFIRDHYINNNNVTPPTVQMIQESLKTGRIQDGNSKINIKDSIMFAKKEISKLIMGGLNNLFDTNELRPNQINLVLTAGRLFNPSGEGQARVNSLTDFISERYQRVSPHTIFRTIEEPYPIVYGLAYYRLTQV